MSKYSYLSRQDGQRQVADALAICSCQLRHWLSIYNRYGAAALAQRQQYRDYRANFKLAALNYKH